MAENYFPAGYYPDGYYPEGYYPDGDTSPIVSVAFSAAGHMALTGEINVVGSGARLATISGNMNLVGSARMRARATQWIEEADTSGTWVEEAEI